MNSHIEQSEEDILDLSPAVAQQPPAAAIAESAPGYINYEERPEKRQTLEHLRGVLQAHESNMSIISNLSGLGENVIYRIHKTGEMTLSESESIAAALESYEANSATDKTERVPSTGEIMLEEEAQIAARKDTAEQSAAPAKTVADQSKGQNLPNRPQLFKIFNSLFFSRLKGSDEYIYVYNDTNTNLRLVVKTGLKDRGTARNSVEFEAFKEIEVFIYDLETTTQIKQLTRTLTWHKPNVNALKEMKEVICDLLLEVHYRPYCSRHRQSMRLVTPFANPNKQFWGCEECKTEKKSFGRENIRGVLTIENHKRKYEELERRLANAMRRRPNISQTEEQAQILTPPNAGSQTAAENPGVIG